MTTFLLIDESKGVTGGDLHSMALALEVNARHCAEAWGVEVPTVELGVKRQRVRHGQWPLFFVDSSSDDPSTLAVHYVSGGVPTGRVYVENASGLNVGRTSVCEAASHEILEMMINPYVDQWRPLPGRPGMETPIEVCDAVQDHYFVEVYGTEWRVSNFLTPNWFNEGSVSGAMDHLGTLERPGEIGPEGYLVIRGGDGRIRYEFGAVRDGFSAREVHSKLEHGRAGRLRDAAAVTLALAEGSVMLA